MPVRLAHTYRRKRYTYTARRIIIPKYFPRFCTCPYNELKIMRDERGSDAFFQLFSIDFILSFRRHFQIASLGTDNGFASKFRGLSPLKFASPPWKSGRTESLKKIEKNHGTRKLFCHGRQPSCTTIIDRTINIKIRTYYVSRWGNRVGSFALYSPVDLANELPSWDYNRLETIR